MSQRKPWYLYLLTFFGLLAILGPLGQLGEVLRGDPPGAVVALPSQVVREVRPGSPLARAGLRVGDRVTGSVGLEPVPRDPQLGALAWRPGVRTGQLAVQRGDRTLGLSPRRSGPPAGVALAWWLITLTHVALACLAIGLMWQRPRDMRAVLLSLILLSAQSFFLPVEPRVVPLALLAHLSFIFPLRLVTGRSGRLAVWGSYFAGFVVAIFWGGWHEAVLRGDVREAAGAGSLAGLLTLVYAALPCMMTARQQSLAADAERRQARALLLASVAIWVATALSVAEALRGIGSRSLPLALLATAAFGVAIFHLLLRLRPLDVRFLLRRSARYALARWALLLSLAVPVVLFAHRLGRASALGPVEKPGWWLPYFLWGALIVVAWRYRLAALRALDRHFFPESFEAQRLLLELGERVARGVDPIAIQATLRDGIQRALQPAGVDVLPPDATPTPDEDSWHLPLRHGERLLGTLVLGPKRDGLPYTEEEHRLVEMVAAHAALALESARLYAELRERDRQEVALRSQAVLEGAEEERRRLAADLHDQVLPELRQIAEEIERLRATADGRLSPQDGERLSRLESDLRSAAGSVREVMEALSPSALHVLGLGDAVEAYLRNRAAHREPPLAVSCRRCVDEPALGPDRSLILYRICQEAINNLVNHSQAQRARFETEVENGFLRLRLVDDGMGLTSEAQRSGRGLGNMRYRADLAGAAVRWVETPGGGTTVEVTCPLPERAAP